MCSSGWQIGAQSAVWKGKATFRSGGKDWKLSSSGEAFLTYKCASFGSRMPSIRRAGLTLTVGNSYVHINVYILINE